MQVQRNGVMNGRGYGRVTAVKRYCYAERPVWIGGMYERAKSSSCRCISHTGPSVIPSRGKVVALSTADVSSFFSDV